MSLEPRFETVLRRAFRQPGLLYRPGLSPWDVGGRGVRVELWGGETLLYWGKVRELAKLFRTRYPEIELSLFTNGTLLTRALAAEMLGLRIHATVSHDGAATLTARGRDPLAEPAAREELREAYRLLRPLGLISFHATVSPENPSAAEIRSHIAGKLGVESMSLPFSYEQMASYDGEKNSSRPSVTERVFLELVRSSPRNLLGDRAGRRIGDFLESLASARPSASLGQKCGMDSPHAIAVNLEGDLLTCQNTQASAGHRIGSLQDLEGARLDTAWHWSKRDECVRCPVLQLCRGSCMYLTGRDWATSCDLSFDRNLAYLAASLWFVTGMALTEVEGEVVRRRGSPARVSVLSPRAFPWSVTEETEPEVGHGRQGLDHRAANQLGL